MGGGHSLHVSCMYTYIYNSAYKNNYSSSISATMIGSSLSLLPNEPIYPTDELLVGLCFM